MQRIDIATKIGRPFAATALTLGLGLSASTCGGPDEGSGASDDQTEPSSPSATSDSNGGDDSEGDDSDGEGDSDDEESD